MVRFEMNVRQYQALEQIPRPSAWGRLSSLARHQGRPSSARSPATNMIAWQLDLDQAIWSFK